MPLPEINLDPRNEQLLLEQAAQYAIDRSQGQLGNLSPANPLLFLLEAQVFAGSELLFYLNQLPSKLLVQFLNYWGVTTTEGTFATGDLLVTLSGAISTSFTIPSNLLFSDGSLIYRSLNSVVVPSNTLTAIVPVKCESLGSLGNAKQYTINSIITPSPFIYQVTNPSQFLGGTDPIDSDQAIDSYISSIRDSQLVSELDIIRESRQLIGKDWDVRVLPNIDPTSNRKEYGTVAVLIGNATQQTSEATILNLQTHLSNRIQLTTRVWVSLLDYKPTTIKIYGTYEVDQNPQLLADQFYANLQELFLTNPMIVSDFDLVTVGYQSNLKVTSSSINNESSFSIPDKRSALNLKYLEVQLSPNNIDKVRGNNDTNLLWGSELGRLFIYGNGDEN